MNVCKLPLALLMFLLFALNGCSGRPHTNPPPGGAGTVSFTLVSNTSPAHPSLLTFKVTVTDIILTPATGTPTTITLSPAPVIDLMRLQSDSVFLGTSVNVPAGSFTSLSVAFSSPQITFLNDAATVISGCPIGQVCTISPAFSGMAQIATPLTVTASTQQGVGLDFNLNNAISIVGGTLSINFATVGTSGVITAFSLPRTNSNLIAPQLDLIEDFTGVVSAINAQAVTIQSATRGAITVNGTASSVFDANPDTSNPICTNSTLNFANCVKLNQIASVDAILNADGTFSIKEFEPLLPAPQDLVEGIVVSVTSPGLTQFTIVTTDKVQLAANSLITPLNTGDILTVNLPPPPLSPRPFLVDTKGLTVLPGPLNLFATQTDTTAIHPGQTVALHVTNFVAASSPVFAAATVDTVILRWSRFTATAVAPATTALINITGLPSYFNFNPPSPISVQVTSGTLGADGVTNLDGVLNSPANVVPGRPVSLRALYLQNPQNTANPPFFAAKIRQH